MNKTALITGVTGQDGSYLAELLLSKGYNVHGIIRRSSVFTTNRLTNDIWNHERFFAHHGDLTDSSNLHSLIARICPDEVYNLAAQSHVGVSFEVPEYTGEVDAIGTIRLLNAIKDIGVGCKFYQASTSELFGGLPERGVQNEQTPFYPKSPYGAAKLYSYWVTVNYRESYNLFAVNGILFNHESPRRGETFVTKKITKAVANIFKGKQDVLSLGNLDAIRDWGHAKEYVYGMWLMLQQESPQDYVLSTGVGTTIRKFVEYSFEVIGVSIEWKGEGVNEKGYDGNTGKLLVEVNEKYFRPAEVEFLIGDSSKARKELGWSAQIDVKELARQMVTYDLNNEGYGGSEI